MGKAADRRRRAQVMYLARLAEQDPEHFRASLAKRVESRAELIRDRAGHINTPVFPVAAEFAAAIREVAELSGRDLNREIADTNDTLTVTCCHELAKHASRSRHAGEMYRLTKWPQK